MAQPAPTATGTARRSARAMVLRDATPKLLDQLRGALRSRHCSRRTE